jgi:hypothetical protein
VVWHVVCWVEQLSRHDVLAVALLVAVAAPVGGIPGTTQFEAHIAAWELQVIMQFVVIELCASRIRPSADAPDPNPTMANAAKTMLTAACMIASFAERPL